MMVDQMIESWRAVSSNQGFEISSLGNVRRRGSGQKVKPHTTSGGYYRVAVSGDRGQRSQFVHRLVAAAFIGEPPAGHQVNHKDGVKKNNCATNLEYVTPSENLRHAYRLGLKRPNAGQLNGNSIMTNEDALRIAALKGSATAASIARERGVSDRVVASIWRGDSWSTATGIVRQPKGLASRVRRSVLTEDRVKEIFSLEGSASYAQLARRFGVSRTAIYSIFSGRRWSHLTGRNHFSVNARES